MSDLQIPDLTDPSDDEPTVTPAPSSGGAKGLREAVEQSNRRANAAEQELAAAKRELAIERAQLPDFPGKPFFLQNYQGEATPEAIKAAAAAAGFQLEAPAPIPVAPAVPAAELAQHRAVAEAAVGSTTGGDVDLADALRGAKDANDVIRIMKEAQAQGIPGIHVVSDVLA